jgi:hypothetical protein
VAFCVGGAVVDVSDGFPGLAGFGDEACELVGFEGEGGVDRVVVPRQCDVLLDGDRTERDCGDRHAEADGVVGEPHLASRQLAQVRDGGEVAVTG